MNTASQIPVKDAQEQRKNSVPARRVIGRPFKPGQSGNPGGRPKGTANLAALVQRFLSRNHPQGEEFAKLTERRSRKLTRLEVLLIRLEKEDPRTLLAYGFGKPVETHQHSGPEGAPMQVEDITPKIPPERLRQFIQLSEAMLAGQPLPGRAGGNGEEMPH
jgi:hypothetical protein